MLEAATASQEDTLVLEEIEESIQELNVGMDHTDTLVQIADKIEDEKTLDAATPGLESIYRSLNSKPSPKVSLETIKISEDSALAIKVAKESIVEFAKAAFKKIIEMFKKLINFIQTFFQKIFNYFGDFKKKAEDLLKSLDSKDEKTKEELPISYSEELSIMNEAFTSESVLGNMKKYISFISTFHSNNDKLINSLGTACFFIANETNKASKNEKSKDFDLLKDQVSKLPSILSPADWEKNNNLTIQGQKIYEFGSTYVLRHSTLFGRKVVVARLENQIDLFNKAQETFNLHILGRLRIDFAGKIHSYKRPNQDPSFNVLPKETIKLIVKELISIIDKLEDFKTSTEAMNNFTKKIINSLEELDDVDHIPKNTDQEHLNDWFQDLKTFYKNIPNFTTTPLLKFMQNGTQSVKYLLIFAQQQAACYATK